MGANRKEQAMKPKSTFAARAQSERKRLGLSCQEVADDMNNRGFDSWTEWTVKGIENDKREIKAGELNAYAKVLKTDRDYLFPADDYGSVAMRPYLTAA